MLLAPLAVLGKFYGRYMRSLSKRTQDALAEATQVPRTTPLSLLGAALRSPEALSPPLQSVCLVDTPTPPLAGGRGLDRVAITLPSKRKAGQFCRSVLDGKLRLVVAEICRSAEVVV